MFQFAVQNPVVYCAFGWRGLLSTKYFCVSVDVWICCMYYLLMWLFCNCASKFPLLDGDQIVCAFFPIFFFCFSNKRRLLQLLKWAILLKMLCVLFVISVLVALNRKTINKMQMRVFHFQARNRQVHKHAMKHKQYSNNNRVVCWKLARE